MQTSERHTTPPPRDSWAGASGSVLRQFCQEGWCPFPVIREGGKKKISASKKAGGAARVHTVNKSNFTGSRRNLPHQSTHSYRKQAGFTPVTCLTLPPSSLAHPLFKSKTNPQQSGRLSFSRCPLYWDRELTLATAILCSDTRSSSPSSCSR